MANISAIKLPSGNTYDLVDKTSGYVTTDTKHTAGITEVSSSQIQGGIYLIGTDTPPTSGSEYSRTYTYPSKLYVDSGSGLHTPTGLVIHDPYSNYKVAFAHDTLTENRTYVFPNKTGYVALTSDIKDATLTIQKNGVNIQTFTANASSNKTANIVVNEVPSGGTTGQALVKNSAINYDVSWADVTTTAAQIIRWTEST